MIDVFLPRSRFGPLSWVVSVIFKWFGGVPYRQQSWDEAHVEFRHQGKTLRMDSVYPGSLSPGIIPVDSVPKQPAGVIAGKRIALLRGNASECRDLPFIFSKPEIVVTEDRIDCGPDLLGSIFFLLSRIEEVAMPDRDVHDRFPGSASLSHRSGMLQRPWADELAALFFSLMRKLWPRLDVSCGNSAVVVSCDVDHPYDASAKNATLLLRTLVADIVSRQRPGLAVSRMANAMACRWGDHSHDPYNTFDWYLKACEKAGRKAAFYFIPERTAGSIDGRYDIDEERLSDIFRLVSGKGHEIGQHGSYNSFRNGFQLLRERRRLIDAVAKAGLKAAVTGNRQHVLRWSSSETPDHLDAAGFTYDTTGGFADLAGFRYGTSRRFPMWSWQKLAPLKLEQLPLVVMETTVIAERYMGLGYSPEAFDLMTQLRAESEKHGGNFTLLWHNSHLTTAKDREFFEQLIK